MLRFMIHSDQSGPRRPMSKHTSIPVGRRRLVLAAVILALPASGCSDMFGPVDALADIRIVAPGTILGMGDTAIARVQGYTATGAEMAIVADSVRWFSRDTMVLRLNVALSETGLRPVADPAGVVFGWEVGTAWLVAEVGAFRDSMQVTIEAVPAGVRIYSFRDPVNAYGENRVYSAFSGSCWATTADLFREQHGRELWWTQIGAFVVDARGRPLSRGPTTWSYTNAPALELAVPTDSINDVLYRPAAQGETWITATIGAWSGSVVVYVDPENRCGSIPMGSPEAVLELQPVEEPDWMTLGHPLPRHASAGPAP